MAAFFAKSQVLRLRPVSNGKDGASPIPAAGFIDDAGEDTIVLPGLDGKAAWLPHANGHHRTRTPHGGKRMLPIAAPYVDLGPEWTGVAHLVREREDTRMHLAIDLPNGDYQVFLALGDPSFRTQRNDVRIASAGAHVDLIDPDGMDHFDLWSGRVAVRDGQLLLSARETTQVAKLVQIAIAPANVDPLPPVAERPAGESLSSFELRATSPALPTCPALAAAAGPGT